MTAHNSKQKCEKLAAVVGAPQTTQNLVISRCCFAKDRKECTKIYNSRSQLLFFSFSLLFSDFLVVVVVLV